MEELINNRGRIVHNQTLGKVPFLASIPKHSKPQPYLAHARVSMANLHHHRECGQCQLKAEEKRMNWSEGACFSVECYKYFSWEHLWKGPLINQPKLFALQIQKSRLIE